jgi:hypothetical protein
MAASLRSLQPGFIGRQIQTFPNNGFVPRPAGVLYQKRRDATLEACLHAQSAEANPSTYLTFHRSSDINEHLRRVARWTFTTPF